MMIDSSTYTAKVSSSVLIVANSNMALSRVSSLLDSFDNSSQSIPSIRVISSNPAALQLPLKSSDLLVQSFSYRTIASLSIADECTKHFISKSACSTAIFYDFAQDAHVFYLARLIIRLGINISVYPAAPVPKYKVSTIQAIATSVLQLRLFIKFLFLKITACPVALYSYGNQNGVFLTNKPHIRLSGSRIIFAEFSQDKFKKYTHLLPPSIHYLYIENCEALLSEQARLLVKSILQDISSLLAKRGEIMYFKPRPNQSVSNQICPTMVPFYGTDIPCEDIDMSQATLVTIASIGALSSQASNIISIVDLLIHCKECQCDYPTLHVQSEYVRSFSHSKLLLPNSRLHLMTQLSQL